MEGYRGLKAGRSSPQPISRLPVPLAEEGIGAGQSFGAPANAKARSSRPHAGDARESVAEAYLFGSGGAGWRGGPREPPKASLTSRSAQLTARLEDWRTSWPPRSEGRRLRPARKAAPRTALYLSSIGRRLAPGPDRTWVPPGLGCRGEALSAGSPALRSSWARLDQKSDCGEGSGEGCGRRVLRLPFVGFLFFVFFS